MKMYVKENYASGYTVEVLLNTLEKLHENHLELLKKEGMQTSIEKLIKAFEDYLRGSHLAMSYISEKGEEILQLLSDKLSLVEHEQQRFIEESPKVAQDSTTQQLQAITEAASLARRIVSLFKKVFVSSRQTGEQVA